MQDQRLVLAGPDQMVAPHEVHRRSGGDPALDLRPHRRRAQTPEARLWVAVAVVAQVVAAAQDLLHQFRLCQRTFPHQEEGGARLVA